jgi:hypothetical protein
MRVNAPVHAAHTKGWIKPLRLKTVSIPGWRIRSSVLIIHQRLPMFAKSGCHWLFAEIRYSLFLCDEVLFFSMIAYSCTDFFCLPESAIQCRNRFPFFSICAAIGRFLPSVISTRVIMESGACVNPSRAIDCGANVCSRVAEIVSLKEASIFCE